MIPDSEKLAVMIVGAEAFTRSLFLAAAEESGLFTEPLVSDDAYEAMALLWDAVQTSSLPDVIVTDFDLPDFNAIQFTREVRRHADTRGIYIAILSSSPTELDRAVAETAGVDYFDSYSGLNCDLAEKFQAIARLMCCSGKVAAQ